MDVLENLASTRRKKRFAFIWSFWGLFQVLVVHGIGQAFKRVELGVAQLKSIIECCDLMRSNTEEINRVDEPGGGEF